MVTTERAKSPRTPLYERGALHQNCHSEERSDEESGARVLRVSLVHHPRPRAALGVTFDVDF